VLGAQELAWFATFVGQPNCRTLMLLRRLALSIVLTFSAIVVLYVALAAMFTLMCLYPQNGETCIGARWAVLLAGIPTTLLTLPLGGVGEVMLTGVFGLLQWGDPVSDITFLVAPASASFKPRRF